MINKLTYEPVIGIEIHAQLQTASKIFCGCSTIFGSEPNSQVCPVCLGLPGVLPVLNRKAVEFAVKMGLATHCLISLRSIFARKNYFYPDLPKGYQISQYEEPLCFNGYLEIEVDNAIRKIGINRIHLEEDAGKSVHTEEYVAKNETLIDLNRCGVPLIEIVSEPDIRSPQEAYLYMINLRRILQYLEICDGNMEQGSLRCDANISVRPAGSHKFGVKTEMKNMNSFRGVQKALDYEIQRQITILQTAGTVHQETMLWDEKRNIAIPIRSKEMAHDYRYFPEPDLVPLEIDEKWLASIKNNMPELPHKKRHRFITQYDLPPYDAELLTDNKLLAHYFEATVKNAADAKLVSNWIMKEVLGRLKEQKIDIIDFPIPPAEFTELINLISENVISESIARTVFNEMLSSRKSAREIISTKNLAQVSDKAELIKIVDKIIARYPDEVKKYVSGKAKLFGFLMGQIMKESKGQANPQLVNQILKEKLKSE